MKKRIYFIIAAIVQIIAATHSIFNTNKLIELMLESLKNYPEQMKERISLLFENSGNTYIIIIASLCILMNIIILIKSIKNKNVLNGKGIMLTCSIISFFCATNSLIELLSLVNIIILIVSKQTKQEQEKREKKEIPAINRIDTKKRDIILAIILLLTYLSQLIWSNFIPENINLNGIIIINVTFDIIMLIISLIIFYPKLKRDINNWKNNKEAYFSFVLPKLGIMYLIYFALAFIAMFIADSPTSINQETLELLPLLYTIPAAILWAPIVEEIIFRGCIRRLIKNNKVYIIISALIFGLLHTINEPNILNMLVLAIPYATLGGFYAYLYSKTDNIVNNILCHAFHNTVAIIISILITI